MAKHKKYAPPYPIVEIIWDDASSNSETWVAVSEIEGLEQVVTVGYLVKKTEKAYTVATSVSNEELHEDIVGNTMVIPMGMVVSFRELSVKTKVKKPEKKHDHRPSGAP